MLGFLRMTDRAALLNQIAVQLDTMPEFGQLQIFVRSHIGKVGKADIVKMTTTKYTDNDPNVSVTTDIFRMIKAIDDAHITGNLGFSITFKDGLAETMAVQDFRKI